MREIEVALCVYEYGKRDYMAFKIAITEFLNGLGIKETPRPVVPIEIEGGLLIDRLYCTASEELNLYDVIGAVEDFCQKTFIEMELRYWELERCSDASWVVSDQDKPGWFEGARKDFSPSHKIYYYWPSPERVDEYLNYLRSTCDKAGLVDQRINETGWDNNDLQRLIESEDWYKKLKKSEELQM